MSNTVLSPAEEQMMHAATKAAFLRAAEVVNGITENDVLDAQRAMLAEGVSLARVSRIDRAMLAAQYLKVCADKIKVVD